MTVPDGPDLANVRESNVTVSCRVVVSLAAASAILLIALFRVISSVELKDVALRVEWQAVSSGIISAMISPVSNDRYSAVASKHGHAFGAKSR